MFKLNGLVLLLASAVQPLFAATSMDLVAKEHAVTICRQALNELASSIINENPHRIYAGTQHLNEKELFQAQGAVFYRDRSSHVTFSASVTPEGECRASSSENFVVKIPCIAAREEIFKRWTFAGRLSENSMVLTNQEPERTSYLTEAVDHSYCLVTSEQIWSSGFNVNRRR